ncbi:myb-like dna-binding domain containing protein [Stylonychia lemnae]|uniref:Myb-like dna-binding domain containing protein n=1 Tax=Stylonychia lemnae TaxID=5949 RepID=A0A077ZU62_STYLE|nr:myb-like dna-binding domain containing protein [Stylonychia lemnae]|eukprot:CDW73114.1 myb-like dna-binding domain containing protein [Stylonychia lemnae]
MDLYCGLLKISNFQFKKKWKIIWHNHLDPMVRKSPWNETEEFVFIQAHKIHGNKWAEIAKMIPGSSGGLQLNALEQFLTQDDQAQNEMGSNDQYLIKKLKESGISIETMNIYLRKMYLATKNSDDNSQQVKSGSSPQIKDQLATTSVVRPIFYITKEEYKQTQEKLNESQPLIEFDENNELEFQKFLIESEQFGNSILSEKTSLLQQEYNQSKLNEVFNKQYISQSLNQSLSSNQTINTSNSVSQQSLPQISSIINQAPYINNLRNQNNQNIRYNSEPRQQQIMINTQYNTTACNSPSLHPSVIKIYNNAQLGIQQMAHLTIVTSNLNHSNQRYFCQPMSTNYSVPNQPLQNSLQQSFGSQHYQTTVAQPLTEQSIKLYDLMNSLNNIQRRNSTATVSQMSVQQNTLNNVQENSIAINLPQPHLSANTLQQYPQKAHLSSKSLGFLHITGGGTTDFSSKNSMNMSEQNSEIGDVNYQVNNHEMSLGISSVASNSNYNQSDASSIRSFASGLKQTKYQQKSNMKSKFFQQQKQEKEQEEDDDDFDSYDEEDFCKQQNIKMDVNSSDDEDDNLYKNNRNPKNLLIQMPQQQNISQNQGQSQSQQLQPNFLRINEGSVGQGLKMDQSYNGQQNMPFNKNFLAQSNRQQIQQQHVIGNPSLNIPLNLNLTQVNQGVQINQMAYLTSRPSTEQLFRNQGSQFMANNNLQQNYYY